MVKNGKVDVSKTTKDFENNTTKSQLQRHKITFIFLAAIVLLLVVILGLVIYLIVTNGQQLKTVNNVDDHSTTTPQHSVTFQPLPSWPPPSNSPLGIFDDATVAADNGICSEIGRNVLIRGGNAVDASIAALFCIGVMDAQSSGLGGGHFMTIYNKTTQTCTAIDAREVAPMNATMNMYENTTDGSLIGYLALAVPSQLAGFWVAYKNFGGGVPWSDLVEPTIELCEKGYAVSPALAETILSNWDAILNEPTLNIFINNKTGGPYQAGDIMTRPVLGSTLRKLAMAPDPVELFYNSNMTKQMVQEIQQGGGIITMEDMQNYVVKWGQSERPIIVTALKGNLRVCGPPPPSSTAVTSAILNILDGYNLTPDSLLTVESNVDVYHKLIESMKFAYAARELLGDMDFVPSALGVAYDITSPAYGLYIRSKILPTAQNLSYYQAAYNISTSAFRFEDHGTSHVSAVDFQGNAVSTTSTINTDFGAMVRSLSTGIIWNNEMDDFSQPNVSNYFNFAPTENNYIVPGKRPLSSMSPIVVYDADSGNVTAVSGVAGGSRIISANAQVLLRTLYFNQTVKEAIDTPRLHNQLQPIYTEYELGFPQLYVNDLIAQHNQDMTVANDTSVAAALTVAPNGTHYSSSDYRKGGGYPSGY